MHFKIKRLGLASGRMPEVILGDDDAFALGAKPGDRVTLMKPGSGRHMTGANDIVVATVDLATGSGIVARGEIGLYDEVVSRMKLVGNENLIEVILSARPRSYDYIKEKIHGKMLSAREIQDIINDCTNGNLTQVEMAAFVIGLEINGASDDEVVNLTEAMARSGEILDFGPDVFDKHSTGGVPGNKVTIVIVPIVAAAGLFIPKTSTRAITSPSGTADSMEVLAKVAFTKDRLLEILKNELCGIFWGGAIDSAPADNALINVEKPLSMDPFPLMIASIICKKMSLGVKKLVLDVPCGKGTKFPTVENGKQFAYRFKEIARRVGIDATCLLTLANQPIGHAVGPALEAREALSLLMNINNGPSSLMNKSTELAGVLLEMGGKAPEGKGKELAIEILRSGKAYEAMKRMIKAQGGDPEITPADIKVGPHVSEMRATVAGHVVSVENKEINRIAKIAGCPASKGAGIVIEAKIGAKVNVGDVIFRIYSDNENRLKEAVEYYNAHPPHQIGGMTLERV